MTVYGERRVSREDKMERDHCEREDKMERDYCEKEDRIIEVEGTVVKGEDKSAKIYFEVWVIRAGGEEHSAVPVVYLRRPPNS